MTLRKPRLDQSLKLLKAKQDKKKAMLKQEFDEGKMDGAAYYAALDGHGERKHHQSSIALIDQKIAAENKLYPAQIQAIQELSQAHPGGQGPGNQCHAAWNMKPAWSSSRASARPPGSSMRKSWPTCSGSRADWREKINDLMAQAAEDNALGPIAEKEAEINRYLRERAKLRREIPDELQGQFDKDTQTGVWKKTTGEEIEGWASTISNGFKNLFDSHFRGHGQPEQGPERVL